MIVFGPTQVPRLKPPFDSARALFPDSACGAFADSSETPAALLPDEAECVRRAVPSRRREFAVGRWCARNALEQLQVVGHALTVGPDRAPKWPAEVVGSISHCKGFVGAVVAQSASLVGLGFDVELAAPLEDALVTMICTDTELDWSATIPPPPATNWPKVIFSAKESVHKCIAPLSGVMLDFLEVTLSIRPEDHTFSAKLVASGDGQLPHFTKITGRFAIAHGFVMTSAFIDRKGLST